MEQKRKNLKLVSFVVLALGALSLLNTIFELFFGTLDEAFKNTPIPEGITVDIILISKIFVLVLAVLLFLPQLYIGIKGMKIAKNPDTSKGHIVWGIILLVLSGFSLLSSGLALFQSGADLFAGISELCSMIVDFCFLVQFVCLAREIRKELL